MPSLLPFTISDFAATTPSLKNPSPNFKTLEQSPESPPTPSFFTVGSPTVASTTYRCLFSDYFVGSMQDKPYITVVLAPAAGDIAATSNETWRHLRDALALPVNVVLLREDGASIRGYDLSLGAKLKALSNHLVVNLTGSFGSVRN